MNKARDLVALAIMAFQKGQYDAAAKFFTSAVGSDDLDSFVDEVTRNMPRSARNGHVPESENTLAPSIASAQDLTSIVEHLEQRFRVESSMIDEGDEEVEQRASHEDDFDFQEAEAGDYSEDEESDEEDQDDLEDLDDEEEFDLAEEDDEFDAEATDTDPEGTEGELEIVASAGPVRIK